MHGQTNQAVLEARLQGRLRKSPTDAERRMWTQLRGKRLLGAKFRRQHPYEAYILDFVCIEHKIIIEIDGSQHLNSERDAERDALLASAGFKVLRFWNNDVLTRTHDVLESIAAALLTPTQNHPHPGPPLEGEGEKHV